MTAEELEARMAQPPSPPPQTESPIKPIGQVLPMVRPERAAQPLGRDEERRKQAMRERRRAEVAAARTRLEPHIDRRILLELHRQASPCALILGPTGAGKTMAAQWLREGFGGTLMHARELGSSERRHGLGDGYPPEMHAARSARVLYLDDIGAEDARDLNVLQYAIEYRYAHQLPTVATTGLDRDELSSHLGAAYVRRLKQQHVRRGDGEWPVTIIDLFQR